MSMKSLKSGKCLHDQVPELLDQGSKSGQNSPKIDISLVHFSPSGKIRLQKLKRSSNFHQKSWKSENSLASLFNHGETESSGFSDGTKTEDQLSVPSLLCHTFGRRKSRSLNNIPLALLSTSTLQSQGESAASPCNTQHRCTNLNVSSLKSSKSIQMLNGEDIETIARNIQKQRMAPVPFYERVSPDPPAVPERKTAFLENCTVADHYLIQQGKRLSGLPFDHTVLDEEKKS